MLASRAAQETTAATVVCFSLGAAARSARH
jgi:hypothetical protein